MISILLLLVLTWGFYIGYRRGLVLQVYYFLVAVISAFVAGQFYKSLGDHFHLLVPYANPQEGQGTFFFPSDQLFHLDKVFLCGSSLSSSFWDLLHYRTFYRFVPALDSN